MKHFLIFLSCFSLSFSINAQTLQSVESVEYDASHDRFFVSNSNNIIARNSDGSLSYFGNGAASAGMEVMGNTLFAIDGSSVRGFDLTTEEQVMSINIPGASFLNGMTNDGDQNLYVTDFSTKKIHKINVADLSAPTSEIIVANTVSTPNGIIYDGDNNRLIFVNWSSSAKIKAVDLSDNSVSTLITTPYSNIDGIDEDNEGNYYISYWSSGTKISKYDANFVNPPLTISATGLSNPADICYAKAIDTLAIPHSGNQLSFIGFDPIASVDLDILDEDFQLSVYPNPIQENSKISFTLKNTSDVNLQIYDQKGQLLHVLLNGKQVRGIHHVMLEGLALPKGIFFAYLKVNGTIKMIPLMGV